MKRKIRVQIGSSDIDLELVSRDENTYLVEDDRLGTLRVKILSVEGDKVELAINDRKYTVLLDRSSRITYVNGIPIKLLITKPHEHLTVKKSVSATKEFSSKVKVISAPLSGRIVSIKVRENDHIRKGDVILVIESMKMLNEIRSPHSGIVLKINVSEGDIVKKGQELLIIG
ncbi:MAG: hypothetical protein DRO23_03095 [Thermoprotei archaeon]|nr:MAG: hypothetical protein DRO23_03095 [Thermoprotei archaeon]